MKFMKIFWAALLAVVVGSILSGLFWLITLLGVAGSAGGSAVAVTDNTILKIDLADNITDSPVVNPFAGINFASMQPTRTLSLLNVLRAIDAAAEDERIKGIYLNFNYMGSVTTAALEELREAIVRFKQSGKFVVAHNDVYPQGAYYLATAADKIYLQPQGSVSLTGMSSTILFFKGAFDRLGISCEAFRPTACKYKSAVEPYIMNKMSEPNRRQNQELCDQVWDVILTDISEARGIDKQELNRIADTLDATLAEDALKHKLVDGLLYADQMETVWEELGVEKGLLGDYEMVSLGDYCSIVGADMKNLSAPKVGIVYAEGQIVDGDSDNDGQTIYGTTLAQTIADARKDESIKAVVLRVNSPGGSALASDVIWREVELLKAEKPVIVSMGSYAASGGYYISAPADAIVADRLTLTGSIGVFGMLLEGGDMLRNKLGITTDGVKTNSSADFGANVFGLNIRKPTAIERKALIRSVDNVYEVFTEKVAAGRNLDLARVLEIAEGRVWSGTEAVKIGLADTNGGLLAAISLAADKAGIADNFRVEEVMGELSPFMAFMQSLGAQVKSALVDSRTAAAQQEYEQLQRAMLLEGVQAICPVRLEF